MRLSSSLKVALVGLAVLLTISILRWRYLEQSDKLVIDSFEDCAAAGYPLMEIYPEQCRTPDGRLFVAKTLP